MKDRKEQIEVSANIALACMRSIDRLNRGCYICGLLPEESGLPKPKGISEMLFPTSCPKCGKYSLP